MTAFIEHREITIGTQVAPLKISIRPIEQANRCQACKSIAAAVLAGRRHSSGTK